jgi:hypothetical protein
MLALTGARVKATMASYDRKLELDEATYRRSNAAIAKALRDGAHLTRPELGEALRRARVEPGGTQRLSHLVLRAELDAVVCSGPRRGKQFTYALLDERVPAAPPRDRDEALLALATRYFATRGPATPHDFAWWSGLTVGDARRAVDMAGDALERVTVDDTAYWAAPPVVAPPRPRAPVAHLLPNYDELFVGYRNRAAAGQRLRAFDSAAVAEVLFAHVVEVDGQFLGGWTREIGRDRVEVALDFLVEPTPRERKAIAGAAARYGAFLGLDAAVTG